MELVVGMDVHKDTVAVSVIDPSGQEREATAVENTAAGHDSSSRGSASAPRPPGAAWNSLEGSLGGLPSPSASRDTRSLRCHLGSPPERPVGSGPGGRPIRPMPLPLHG